MEVETNLAPRDHAYVVDEVFDLLFDFVVVEAGVVRMRADRCVDCAVTLPELDRPLKRITMRIASADIENHGHARGLRALHYLFAIGVKFRTINVRMRVDKHSFCAFVLL